MLPLGEAERAVGEVFCGEPLAGEGLGTFKALSSSLTPSLTPGEKKNRRIAWGTSLYLAVVHLNLWEGQYLINAVLESKHFEERQRKRNIYIYVYIHIHVCVCSAACV